MPSQVDKLAYTNSSPGSLAPNDMCYIDETIPLNADYCSQPRQETKQQPNYLNHKPYHLASIDNVQENYYFAADNGLELAEKEKIFDQANYESRLIEVGRFIAGLFHSPFLYVAQSDINFADTQDPELELALVVGNSGGLLTASILNYFLKDKFKNEGSLNPFYRVFKTMAKVGLITANGITAFLQIPPSFLTYLLTDVISLSLGLAVAVLDWLLCDVILQVKNFKYRNVDAMLGYGDGWSKYGNTFLVYGMYLGMIVGAIIAGVTNGAVKTSMLLWSAIVGVGSFLLAITLVPLINKYFNKKLICVEKDGFRGNYVRSGITLFLALGTITGFFIGSFAWTALGAATGMMLFGAIFSVIGGLAMGLAGKNLSIYMQKHWNVSDNTDNSFDYSSRNMAYVFSYLGTAIGFLIGGPLGLALGYAIGNAIGWGIGVFITKLARTIYPIEVNVRALETPILPWTQRVARGANVYATIFMALGFIIGAALGMPFQGATIGFGFGGFIGGAIGALYKYSTISAAAKELNAPEKEIIFTQEPVALPAPALSTVESIQLSEKNAATETKVIPIQSGITLPSALDMKQIKAFSVLPKLDISSATDIDSSSTNSLPTSASLQRSFSFNIASKTQTELSTPTSTPPLHRRHSLFSKNILEHENFATLKISPTTLSR